MDATVLRQMNIEVDWWSLFLQDDNIVTGIAKVLLPALASSSPVLIQGEGFTAASKHAEALRNLAAVWESLAKTLANDWSSLLVEKERKLVKEACQATHTSAATPKVRLWCHHLFDEQCISCHLPGFQC